MIYIFNCKNCKLDFEVQHPEKKEYTDYTFGPCSKNIAYCPKCSAECSEKPKRKPLKYGKPSAPLIMENNCCRGSGCCG